MRGAGPAFRPYPPRQAPKPVDANERRLGPLPVMKPSHNAARPPLGPEAKPVLKVVFVTLFLDLVGFSIIFPLFPHMLEHYLFQEQATGPLTMLVDGLTRFSEWAGVSEQMSVTVLFGGVLGSLYSILQFVCAPILGRLSDRFGRKPILLVSIAGIAVSYGMWFFAGTFAMLVAARVLGGMMSGNISTATAVVADVTTPENRSRGMAIIGIAFGVGFMFGPVIGGLAAGVDLTSHWPALADYGVNPFSVPALAALLLALGNLFLVAVWFRETLRPGAPAAAAQRTVNPTRLFRAEAYPGVTRTNMVNFMFLLAFSGMEFSLAFLAVERFAYGPREIAFMLLFTGIVLAVTQGTYVQARSAQIGVKRMSGHGMLMVMAGLVILAAAPNPAVLYCGLFFLGAGSAQVIPCLTTLASVYAPAHEQGRILGVFRSLGALARAVGPLAACLLYWRLGAEAAYFLAALFMTAPLLLIRGLPTPGQNVPARATVPAEPAPSESAKD